MAAVARPPVAAGTSGLKAALITFVCLTVGSLGGLVYLFTLQSDYESRMAQKDSAAATAQKSADEAGQQLSGFAKEVIGEATNSPADIQNKINAIRTALARDNRLKSIRPDMALVSAVQALKAEYDNTAKQLADMTAERDKLNANFTALNEAAKANEQHLNEQLTSLRTQYETMEAEATSSRKAWADNVADLKKQLASSNETAGKQLAGVRQAVANLDQQLSQRDARIKELRETLASFRPSADQLAPLQVADGTIVRLVPGQSIVYISLGSQDRVRPGMNFAVYSRYRGIPADGKGKASLVVTQVFDTTSEARVLSTTPADPIIEGDIIANPVYDRNRQFNFVVAGDFDLDFNGKVEDRGGQQVARMIESWGGKVVKTVDTRTDFVVLGAPPAGPPPSTATDAATIAEHKAEHEADLKSFEAIEAEAKALSIPILTRTQFLHFIGQPVPGNAKEGVGT
jgi:prefoldin subunit 5